MTRYELNTAAFGRVLLRAEFLREHLDARAERVKEAFEATAPVGSPYETDDHPGRYRDSASVESGTMHVPNGRGERAYGRVVVSDPAAMSIEFGHAAHFDARGRWTDRAHSVREVRVEGSHTLTRALDAAG